MTSESWRCRHGFHAFRFVEMTNRRRIDAPSEPAVWVCRLAEACDRCGLWRITDAAHLPRRVRLGRNVPHTDLVPPAHAH